MVCKQIFWILPLIKQGMHQIQGGIDAVPGSASSLQDLICNPVEDLDRVPGICAGADEVVIMPEKHIQRTIQSCNGIVGLRRLVIVIIALTALSGYALAHTPAGVAVSYDESTGDLGVAITHQVDDPATHYVKHVTVRQGTTVLIGKSYASQPDKSAFTYRYNLPQLKGSSGEITVDVECNIFGSRSGTLMLTRTQVPPDSLVSSDAQQPTPLPAKSGALPFVALLAAGLAATRIMR
jgi:hypothetical protein